MNINSTKNSESDTKESNVKSMRIELSEIKSIIRNDDHQGLQRLLQEDHIDVNAELIIEKGVNHSLLTMACMMGSINCVKVLLDNGANIIKIPACTRVSFERAEFRSPFCYACTSGNTELLHLLFERGVKLNDSVLLLGFYILEQSALEADKRQAIAAVLIQYITNVDYKERGHTFLHRVCSIGGINNVKAILERGVNRDAPTASLHGHSGQDALCTAAAKGHLDIVELLLGWDKNNPIEMRRVNKAMIEAARCDKLKVVQFLTEYGAEYRTETLVAAARYARSLDIAEYLLDYGGANINGTLDGDTPLVALLSNTRTGDEAKLRMARFLLARGADRNATNCYGKDVLALAAYNELPDFLQLILEHSSSQPITFNQLNTALLMSLGRSEGVTKCLLDHGADVNVTDADGHTPLMLLCSKDCLGRHRHMLEEYLPTIQLLLERGADPRAVSPVSGQTALLCAGDYIVAYRLALSTLLLDHGADVNQGNATTGETPLMRAALAMRITVVKLYLEHGADVMQLNNEGLTVLDLMGDKPEYAMYVELCREYGDVKPLLK